MNKPVCQSYCRGDAARNGWNGKKLASRNIILSDRNIFSCPTPDLNPSQNFNPIQFSPKRQKFTHYTICWGAIHYICNFRIGILVLIISVMLFLQGASGDPGQQGMAGEMGVKVGAIHSKWMQLINYKRNIKRILKRKVLDTLKWKQYNYLSSILVDILYTGHRKKVNQPHKTTNCTW